MLYYTTYPRRPKSALPTCCARKGCCPLMTAVLARMRTASAPSRALVSGCAALRPLHADSELAMPCAVSCAELEATSGASRDTIRRTSSCLLLMLFRPKRMLLIPGRKGNSKQVEKMRKVSIKV